MALSPHRMMTLACALLLLLAVLAEGRRPPRPPRHPASVHEDQVADQQTAASSNGILSRVQIKVYRGPDHHHHHASHGYWIKQPADDVPQNNNNGI